MKFKKAILIILILHWNSDLEAQFTDRYWCFGDSSAIDFSVPSSPVPGSSILRTRGTCASICDSSGNLLFYAGSPHIPYWQSGVLQMGYVVNKNDSMMENGDSLKTTGWYQEMVIVPNPGNVDQFYVFNIGETSTTNPGLFYSVVDLSFNNGLGKVVQKNVQLQNQEMCDGLTAIKHGNGRDWWIISKSWQSVNNGYYLYLISDQGISGPFIQNAGTPTDVGFFRLVFSKSGDRFIVIDYRNLMELYSFDRCTGQITLIQTIQNEYPTGPYPGLWSVAISPNDSVLYVTAILNGQNQDTSYLFQYNLNSANIAASKDTLHTFIWPSVAGFLKLAPDNKIYLSCSMEIIDCGFDYTYCDTSYYPENMNLSVINSPDSIGLSCNFMPFSFYLGGHRTYYGLPNNPNYSLGPLQGSICDTLGLGILEVNWQSAIHVYPNPVHDILRIQAENLYGRSCKVFIRNILGQIIQKSDQEIYNGRLDLILNFEAFPSAMYFISIETEKDKLVQKIVKDR